MEQSRKEPKLWPSVMGMGGFVVLAGFIFLLITQGTPEFYRLSIYHALFGAMGLTALMIPLTALILLLLSLIRSKFSLPRWVNGKLFVSLGMFAILFAFVFGCFEARPKARLMSLTSGAAQGADNVRVAGFNAFLSRRWLFTFDVTEAEFLAITKSLKLEVSEDIDLKSSLESVHGMMGKAKIVSEAPQKEAKLKYSRIWAKDTFAEWVTMIYSESTRRAWLFYGYQN